jgi:hypothetical protein
MSRPHLPNAVRQRIFVEARFRCGYCHAQQDVIGMQLHIEHIGLTAVGRVTVLALDLNQPNMVRARRRWVMVGWHPPKD